MAIIPLIEYQEDRQRTPDEVFELMKKEKNIGRVFIWYEQDGKAFYVPGSKERNFTNADIYWALSKLLNHFMENV